MYNTADTVTEAVWALGHPIKAGDPLDPLIERIGDARYVLLGEASHGTSEYYLWRARISRRLIEEKGFRFLAVEGDWPPCYGVNRYVRGYPGSGAGARDVLRAFDRWPTWMWANWEIVALVRWLRRHNDGRDEERKVGFYGLDLYSLWESMAAVLQHLSESHPDAVESASQAFNCFEPFNRDEQSYAWSTRLTPEDCADEVVQVLRDLRSAPPRFPDDPEAHFDAEQNALVAVEAERYYRTMARADGESWNVRDTHMADTLDRLMQRHGPDAKAIVWEHNTHIGDARATDMAAAGMVNVGQLVRERHGAEGVALVGFGSYQGSVIAGETWGAPMQRMPVPPARPGSWEHLLHTAGAMDRLLILQDFAGMRAFEEARDHRAIGVVYRPDDERSGNYVPTVLPERYDAFIYLDQTRALHPLHQEPHGTPDPPETFPWGM
jgi:erythromycin esterase-like protein